MDKTAIAKYEKACGARWAVETPSQWQQDYFYTRFDEAERDEMNGLGEMMAIDEYIERGSRD